MGRKPRISTIPSLQQYNIPIAAGGSLTVSLTSNFLYLNKDERALFDGLITLLHTYEQAHPLKPPEAESEAQG